MQLATSWQCKLSRNGSLIEALQGIQREISGGWKFHWSSIVTCRNMLSSTAAHQHFATRFGRAREFTSGSVENFWPALIGLRTAFTVKFTNHHHFVFYSAFVPTNDFRHQLAKPMRRGEVTITKLVAFTSSILGCFFSAHPPSSL
jgi:hypothetical protein